MNGQVLIYDARSGKHRLTITPPGFNTRQGIERIDALAVNASSVSGSNPGGTRYTWDVRTGRLLRKTPGPAAVASAGADALRIKLAEEGAVEAHAIRLGEQGRQDGGVQGVRPGNAR